MAAGLYFGSSLTAFPPRRPPSTAAAWSYNSAMPPTPRPAGPTPCLPRSALRRGFNPARHNLYVVHGAGSSPREWLRHRGKKYAAGELTPAKYDVHPQTLFSGFGSRRGSDGGLAVSGVLNGRRPNFPHGGASTAGSVQRAIGPRSSGAGRPHRRGGAATSGFRRSARSVCVGAGRASSASQYHCHDVAFRCDAHGRSPPDAPESRVDRERTDVSDLLRWRARRLPERIDPWLQKGAPPSLARRHPNAEKARSGMDIIPPTPKFGSGRIFTPRRRSRSRGSRDVRSRGGAERQPGARARRTHGISGRWCRAVREDSPKLQKLVIDGPSLSGTTQLIPIRTGTLR